MGAPASINNGKSVRERKREGERPREEREEKGREGEWDGALERS